MDSGITINNSDNSSLLEEAIKESNTNAYIVYPGFNYHELKEMIEELVHKQMVIEKPIKIPSNLYFTNKHKVEDKRRLRGF